MTLRPTIETLLRGGMSVSDVSKITEVSKDYVYQIKQDADITNGTEKLVEHHVKYKEIHGYDETVWLTGSEHRLLHNRLRREGNCIVPVDELTKISEEAYHRTSKAIEIKKRYNESDRGKEVRRKSWKKHSRTDKFKATQKKYRETEKGKKYHRNYDKNNIQTISSSETIGQDVQFEDSISYNHITGSVYYYATFRCSKGCILPKIDIS